MKWFFILSFVALGAVAESEMVDEIKRLEWDGENYKVQLNSFQKPMVISGANEVIPCLENAQKANMKVLVTVDADIPMIKECALYTPGIIRVLKQAQEEAGEVDAASPIPKR